jgi:hypothetical protein
MAEEPVREDGTASQDETARVLFEELHEIYSRTADEAAKAEPHKRIPDRVGHGLLAVGEDEKDFCPCGRKHSVPRGCFEVLPNPHARNVLGHSSSRLLDEVAECLERNSSPVSLKTRAVRELFDFGEADVPRAFTKWLELARKAELRWLEGKARFGHVMGSGKPPKILRFNRECAEIASAIAPIFREKLEQKLKLLSAKETSEIDAKDNRFVREGSLWFISHDGETAHLRTMVGLEYIAILLRNPLKDIEARGILAMSPSTGSGVECNAAIESEIVSGEAGSDYELLDPKARQQYQARARVLEKAIADAKDRQDTAKRDELNRELEFIADQLSADTGLRGKTRKFSDDNEKARMSVTNAIQRALEKIETVAPKTAAYLKLQIKTGSSLTYLDKNTLWKF